MSPNPPRDGRIDKALNGVDLSAPDFSVDRLYAAAFPAGDVDLHKFRQAAMIAMKKAEKKV